MSRLIELFKKDIAIKSVTPIYQYYTDGETFSVQYRENCGFVFLSDCSIFYTDRHSQTLSAPKNSIVFLPEGSSYEAIFSVSEKKSDKNHISDFLINFKIIGNEPLADIGTFPSIISENIPSAARLITGNIFSLETAQNRLKLNGEFYVFLNTIITNSAVNDSEIQPSIDLLNSNPDFGSVSVARLAAECNMHITTFRRHFEAALGISPQKYIQNSFISRANYHLITEQRSVKEVAYMLGFESVSYFSRFYKENTGLTPSETKSNRL